MANTAGSKHTSHKTPKTESATKPSGGSSHTSGTEKTNKSVPKAPIHEHMSSPGPHGPSQDQNNEGAGPNGEHKATNY